MKHIETMAVVLAFLKELESIFTSVDSDARIAMAEEIKELLSKEGIAEFTVVAPFLSNVESINGITTVPKNYLDQAYKLLEEHPIPTAEVHELRDKAAEHLGEYHTEIIRLEIYITDSEFVIGDDHRHVAYQREDGELYINTFNDDELEWYSDNYTIESFSTKEELEKRVAELLNGK